MYHILPIPAFNDNYIWLLHDGRNAVCVDPGDAAPVLATLAQLQLNLQAIVITHHHHDHIGGVPALQAAIPKVPVYGPAGIDCVSNVVGEGSVLDVLGLPWQVWFVPGHTHNHLAYLLQLETDAATHVFCGDTLFSAGCGRVFCGTVGDLYRSISRFAAMPSNTLFYPAHEYTASNLRFALSVEAGNQAAQTALQSAAQTPTLPTELAHELAINPFMRLDSKEIVATLAAQNLPHQHGEAVFASLRQLKNGF